VQLETKVVEVRVNKLAANIVGILLTILFCALGVGFAHLLPYYTAFAGWHLVALLVSMILLTPIHEALHAVGLARFAGVSRRQIRFGMMWRALMPYCHCTVPISVRAYRRMIMLPLIGTGLATVIPLLFFPADWLGLLTGVTVAACVGDVWMFAKMRRFGGALLVKDSPTEIGCDVYLELPPTAA
jgi:hypothetical protein